MPGLPRPDLEPGPHRQLNDALHDLHHEAGWPSLRTLAGQAGCSHTTVSHAFSTTRFPSWSLLEQLVEGMHGDTGRFHQLWLAASDVQQNGAAPPAPRLAGRREELAVVRRHLESGRGLLVVAGEAGIGKTRLVSTAAALASDRAFVASGHCLPLSSQVPLLPVTDLLRTILDRDGWLTGAVATCPAYVAASLSRLLPELAEVATVTDPDDDWSRHRLFSAVAAALDAAGRDRPLAVVVEDLHWADSTTLDLLEHLVVHGVDVPVIGTRRLDDPDTRPASTAWWDRVRRAPALEVLQLGSLSAEDTREQLALLLGPGVDPGLADRIHARSLGQPLFTEQLAVTGGADSPGLPVLLADILDHRLTGLSPSAWRLAAVLGTADRPLRPALLGAASGVDPEELSTALHELSDLHLLAEEARPDVALRHPLLAEAVRRRLLPAEAVEGHRRLAVALAASPAASAAEVATHWRGAGDVEQEARWRVAAARDAERRFAAAQAATHWLRVLDLWPAGSNAAIGDPPVSRLDAHLAAMDALEGSAQNDRASVVVARALSLAPGLDDTDLAELYRRAADYLADIDETAALDLVDRAIHLLGDEPSPGLLRATRLRSAILGDLGQVEEALVTAGRAVVVSRQVGDPALVRGALMSLAWHEAVAGSVDDALRHADAASRLAAAGTDPMGEVGLAMRHTDILLICGADVGDLERAAAAGLDAVQRWQIDTVAAATLLANVSEALRRAGLVERAGELVDPWTEGPLQLHRWALHIERAKLDMLRGRSAEAISRFAQLSDLDLPSLWSRAELARCVARNHLWLGQPEAALDCLLPVIDEAVAADALASMGPLLVLTASAAADAIERLPADAAEQRRRELLAHLQAARDRVSSDPLAAWRRGTLAASWAAELARIEGSATVDVWLAAAAGWDDVDRPHRAAYCRWRAAQVARRSGQAATAGKLLRRASRDAREHVPLLTWIHASGAG